MIVWLWDATGPDRNGRGVSDDGDRARQAAQAYLSDGQATAARVERAVSILGICTLATGYQRTGDGWVALHRDGRTTWIPFAVGLPAQMA